MDPAKEPPTDPNEGPSTEPTEDEQMAELFAEALRAQSSGAGGLRAFLAAQRGQPDADAASAPDAPSVPKAEEPSE